MNHKADDAKVFEARKSVIVELIKTATPEQVEELWKVLIVE